MTIETKKVASVNEAISIINRLNYTNETFHYNNSTFSDDYKVEYRFCDGVRDNGLYSGMSIIEIVIDGTLQTVRFFNHFCDITVDLRIGDFIPDYDRFDTVINVNDIKTTESDNLTPTETKKDFRDRHTDSLIRAMKINLEKFQEFCRVKNLVQAQNEMKLYTICSRAMSKLWATDKFLTIHTD